MVVIRVAGDEILAMLNLDQVWVATAEVVSRGWRGWQREVGRTLRIDIMMIIVIDYLFCQLFWRPSFFKYCFNTRLC